MKTVHGHLCLNSNKIRGNPGQNLTQVGKRAVARKTGVGKEKQEPGRKKQEPWREKQEDRSRKQSAEQVFTKEILSVVHQLFSNATQVFAKYYNRDSIS